MITKYITSISTAFNPLSRSRAHKIPRIFLAFLKPDARSPSGGAMTITNTVLPAASTVPSSLVVTFRDGRTMKFLEKGAKEGQEWDLSALGMNDVVAEVDRHSRVLGRTEALNG